jgi:hypothetical protein
MNHVGTHPAERDEVGPEVRAVPRMERLDNLESGCSGDGPAGIAQLGPHQEGDGVAGTSELPGHLPQHGAHSIRALGSPPGVDLEDFHRLSGNGRENDAEELREPRPDHR